MEKKTRRPEQRAKGNSGLPSRRDGLSLGKRYQFIIQCQMFSPENTHKWKIMETEKVIYAYDI